MALFDRKDKKLAAIKKEHIALLKKEAHFKQKARKAEQPRWKAELEKRCQKRLIRVWRQHLEKHSL